MLQLKRQLLIPVWTYAALCTVEQIQQAQNIPVYNYQSRQ